MNLIVDHAGKKIEEERQTLIVAATLTPKILNHVKKYGWCKKDILTLTTNSIVKSYQKERGVLITESNKDLRLLTKNEYSAIKNAGENRKIIYRELPPNLIHLVVKCSPLRRIDILRNCLTAINAQKCLVFVNYSRSLEDIKNKLSRSDLSVGILHRNLKTQDRKHVITQFRDGRLRTLVTSDVAARGIDFPECDAIFNIDIPNSFSHYVHRAGRSGRAGRDGVVFTIYSKHQDAIMREWKRDLFVSFHEIRTLKKELLPDKKYIQVINDCLNIRPPGKTDLI